VLSTHKKPANWLAAVPLLKEVAAICCRRGIRKLLSLMILPLPAGFLQGFSAVNDA